MCDSVDTARADECVRLPRDADGLTWHLGDEVDTGGRVSALTLVNGGEWTLRTLGGFVAPCADARHRAPTPASRIRDWVRRARYEEGADLRELLGIADDLDGRLG